MSEPDTLTVVTTAYDENGVIGVVRVSRARLGGAAILRFWGRPRADLVGRDFSAMTDNEIAKLPASFDDHV